MKGLQLSTARRRGRRSTRTRRAPSRPRAAPRSLAFGAGDLRDDLAGERQAHAAARVVHAAFGDREVAAARARLRVQLLERFGALGRRQLAQLDAWNRQQLRAVLQLETLRLFDFLDRDVDG